jgi:GNAT superfamily N-acetyltransferase
VQGYIVVQVNSVTAHINKLVVVPEARRTGLATWLLQVGWRGVDWQPYLKKTLHSNMHGGHVACK